MHYQSGIRPGQHVHWCILSFFFWFQQKSLIYKIYIFGIYLWNEIYDEQKTFFVSNIILKGLIFIETKSAFLILKLLFLGVVSLFGKFYCYYSLMQIKLTYEMLTTNNVGLICFQYSGLNKLNADRFELYYYHYYSK